MLRGYFITRYCLLIRTSARLHRKIQIMPGSLVWWDSVEEERQNILFHVVHCSINVSFNISAKALRQLYYYCIVCQCLNSTHVSSPSRKGMADWCCDKLFFLRLCFSYFQSPENRFGASEMIIQLSNASKCISIIFENRKKNSCIMLVGFPLVATFLSI